MKKGLTFAIAFVFMMMGFAVVGGDVYAKGPKAAKWYVDDDAGPSRTAQKNFHSTPSRKESMRPPQVMRSK